MTALAVALRGRASSRPAGASSWLASPSAAAVLYIVLQGTWPLEHNDDAPLFLTLNGVRDWVDANRTVNPVFVYVLGPIRAGIDWLDEALTFAFAHINWVALTAIAGALGLALVSWRTALLVVGSLLAIGLFGLWTETTQTLVLITNAVALSLLLGIPLGILAGRSDRFYRAVTPVLDFMQIMPTFAYLAPLTLIFLIGPPAAVIATLIYAMPPAIRITALGIRGVPPTTVEAATSLGATDGQVLRKVQLPMARGTIGLAVNQTIMMALSIIVVAALINAPGLGESIIVAIEKLQVGAAVQAGIAIVLLATILDRLTASASGSGRSSRAAKTAMDSTRRRQVLLASLGIAVAGIVGGVVLGATTAFPSSWRVSFTQPIDDATRWVEINLNPITDGVKNVVSAGAARYAADRSHHGSVLARHSRGRRDRHDRQRPPGGGHRRGRARPDRAAAGLAARHGDADHGHRGGCPHDDRRDHARRVGGAEPAGSQRSFVRSTTPPRRCRRSCTSCRPSRCSAPTRFTAILAAVIYAAPAVIRLVEDGVRGVSPTAIEAATAAGASGLQTILKVQLPMARRSLLVAVNQGVVLVLAMVVIGGLVGAQALGFDVVAGFSQHSFFGRGMAAAIGIVLLGVMLDRITQGAGHAARCAAWSAGWAWD